MHTNDINWGWFENFRYLKYYIVGLTCVTLPAGSSNVVRVYERVCGDSLLIIQNSFLCEDCFYLFSTIYVSLLVFICHDFPLCFLFVLLNLPPTC